MIVVEGEGGDQDLLSGYPCYTTEYNYVYFP